MGSALLTENMVRRPKALPQWSSLDQVQIDSSFISNLNLSKQSRYMGCEIQSYNEERYFYVIHQKSTTSSYYAHTHCNVTDKEEQCSN